MCEERWFILKYSFEFVISVITSDKYLLEWIIFNRCILSGAIKQWYNQIYKHYVKTSLQVQNVLGKCCIYTENDIGKTSRRLLYIVVGVTP